MQNRVRDEDEMHLHIEMKDRGNSSEIRQRQEGCVYNNFHLYYPNILARKNTSDIHIPL
jgi:hypothetical protein